MRQPKPVFVLKGGEISRDRPILTVWRPFRTRFSCAMIPGAALRLPLATFSHPSGMPRYDVLS
jgi:hypothetical protein